VIQTEAIVLHGFDYRETSRIVRLATREAGVVSVIARGAKRPKSRFGQGLDLFTSGMAQLALHPTGDLHTLTAFDATRARPSLAESLARFNAAAALGELCMRFGPEDSGGAIHDALGVGLDAIGTAEDADVAERTIAAAWRLVHEIGIAPTLDSCASCHRALADDEVVHFSHRAGGALCRLCSALAPGSRPLPADARRTLILWARGERAVLSDRPTVRAHQRLLREFLEEHLADGRPLRAWIAWESSAK
jgi:DNA repair protein RecO (recombination protein O)